MPTMWETFPVEINGGLVSSEPPIQQGVKMPGSATRLVNFEPSILGGYRRINGYTKFDSTVVPFTVSSSNLVLGVGLFDQYVVAAREDKVFSSTGSGWTTLDSGRTQTTKQRFHVINLDGTKKILGVDGSNYPYSWDGTTFANINTSTDVQGAKFVVDFKDHVFYSKGDLVTFSIPFDETDFTPASGAGSFRMPDDVTGMIVFRDRLFVFTESEIKVLDGSSSTDFTLTSVSEEVGCIEPDTIQEVGGDVAFLASDGIRLLGSTDRIGDFSNGITTKAIQDDFNRFRSNYSSFSSCLVRGKSQYRVFGYSSGQAETEALGFIGTQFVPQDHKSFQWSETLGIQSYSMDSQVYNGSESIVFSNVTGYVYCLEDGSNFDGAAIEAQYWTPYFSITDPRKRKTLYKTTFYFSPEGTVDGVVNLNFDQDSPSRIQPDSIPFSVQGQGSNWGEVTWDNFVWQTAPDIAVTKQLVGSGFNVSFQFSFTEDQDPFVFDTIMIEYDEKDRK